jgi:hypothetical protein
MSYETSGDYLHRPKCARWQCNTTSYIHICSNGCSNGDFEIKEFRRANITIEICLHSHDFVLIFWWQICSTIWWNCSRLLVNATGGETPLSMLLIRSTVHRQPKKNISHIFLQGKAVIDLSGSLEHTQRHIDLKLHLLLLSVGA